MYKNFIDGEWRDEASGFENVNPSDTSDVVGVYAEGGREAVAAAVSAAVAGQGVWEASTPQKRFEVLDFIGSEILSRQRELGLLLAREEGKIVPEAVGEVIRAGQIFKYYAGESLRLSGELLRSVRPGVEVAMRREPLGVVGLITPWNFPIAIPAWKIAPALAFGNAAILKPAEQAPGCAWALAEIISRSGLPEGVFHLVMGRGAVAGRALVEHPDVAGLSFTGSVEVGREVACRRAERLGKVQLEMGGKNPLVILDDADLPGAVETAVNGAFYSTGQRCTASSRLIVTEGIHDRFTQGVIDRLGQLKVGDARDPETAIGPLVDGAQLARSLEYIETGRKEGARLVFGGQRLTMEKQGFYLSPALFTETRNEMCINREEIFGPVASVIRARDYEEALVLANDTPFGLSAGICTTSLKYAQHFQQHVRSGMVMVNLPTAGVDYHVPFGGCKGSSYGSREQGRYAAEFYTTVKTTYLAS